MRKLTILALVLPLVGCAMEREARLYPGNETAAANGVLTARFIARGSGSGRVEMATADETFTGDYAIVRQGETSVGTGLGSVYAGRVSAVGTALSVNQSVQNASKGVATAMGSKGTRMECEFYNDNTGGGGYGTCLSSAGASYRLQY